MSSKMDKFTGVLEKFLLPIAHKVSNQRHLSAVKDGFIATMPLALVGAIAAMGNNVFFNNTSLIGEQLNNMAWYANSIQPFLDATLIPIFGQLWWGTIAVAVLFSTVTISYFLAKNLGEDGLIPAVIAAAAYMVLTPQSTEAGGWGTISWTSFNSEAVFAGLITALISTEIYCWVKRKGWIIKMPDGVPPTVSKAFSAVIPAGFTLFILGAISIFFMNVVNTPVQVWINQMLQAPLMALGQSPLTAIFLTMVSQLLWFFGIHGMMITGPVLDLMYGPALNQNLELVQQNMEPIHAITRNFFDVYGMHGGSGSTLGLIIAIFLVGKKPSYKVLAKMSVAPGIFQINEPMTFGLPLVLNPIMAIPFILVAPINLLIAWFFTAVVPFAGYLYMAPPWTTPPIISAFLGSGGDLGATALAAVTLVLAVLMYMPFVIMANREADVE